jgi:isopentenyl-diphosphate delta-isomerase
LPNERVTLIHEATLAEIGTMDRGEAHDPPGHLHQAVSVLLFRPDGRALYQQRHADKATFGGWWANSCCTHPRPGEDPGVAAHRRTGEELGANARLWPAGSFLYAANDPSSDRWEREHDLVFFGEVSQAWNPIIAPAEIQAVRWLPPSEASALFGDRLVPWATAVSTLADSARRARSVGS